MDQGRYAEAEKSLREILEIKRRVLGPEHPSTLDTMNSLAVDFMDQSRYAEAEKLTRETLEIQRRVLGPESPGAALSIYNLGCLAARQGRRDEALSLLGQAVDHGLGPSLDLQMETDPDLKSLHGDPRFTVLVVHAKERAAAQQKLK